MRSGPMSRWLCASADFCEKKDDDDEVNDHGEIIESAKKLFMKTSNEREDVCLRLLLSTKNRLEQRVGIPRTFFFQLRQSVVDRRWR
jgi:hypothetical protein